MKIHVGSDTDAYGTISSNPDGELVYEGDEGKLIYFAKFYAEHLADNTSQTDLTADDLLRHMLARMNGRTWAVEVPA